jgi:hypothetical protein
MIVGFETLELALDARANGIRWFASLEHDLKRSLHLEPFNGADEPISVTTNPQVLKWLQPTMSLFCDVAMTRTSLGRKGDAKNAPRGWITSRDALPPWGARPH